MQTPDYSAYAPLVDAARKKPQLWRLVMGLILVAGVFLICNQILVQTLFNLMGENAFAFVAEMNAGKTPTTLILLLLTFVFLTAGVAVAVRVAHERGITSVWGNTGQAVGQFFAVLVVLVIISLAIFVLPPWSSEPELVPNLSLTLWTVLLPVSVFAVFIQVSAEEVLFRGYIQQQFAARFRSPLIWMGVPAGLFALGHYAPQETGENALVFALWALAFGLLMADLTARAGTLGPAIAVHLVNNVSALLFISVPDSLSGLSLYTTPFSITDTEAVRAWLPVDTMMMLVSWLGARLALRR